MAKEKGLVCSKHNFWLAIRNPVYCGKIFIGRFKDEESCLVQCQHEQLITELLFDQVQDVLNGRTRKQRPKIYTDDALPLRGYLLCPSCGKALIGSASKERNSYYHYYHCTSACSCRIKVSVANRSFVKELKRFIPRKEMLIICSSCS